MTMTAFGRARTVAALGPRCPRQGDVGPRLSIEAGTRLVWAAEAAAPMAAHIPVLLVVPVVMALD